MKAVKRFDPDVGVRLVSFAVHWIRAEIHEYVLRNWRLVKVATTKAQRKLFFNLRKAKKHLGWLSKDETEAVAADLGVTPREVGEMEQRLARPATSPSTPIPTDDEDLCAGRLPAEPEQRPGRRRGARRWDADSARPAARRADSSTRAAGRSSARRWLTDEKATLHELAAEYGVSAERIRQIEANAIKKLRAQLARPEPPQDRHRTQRARRRLVRP